MKISRRKFIKNTGAAAIVTPLAPNVFSSFDAIQPDMPLEMHIFSKHLQFLDIKEAGQVAAELGFDGLDLTVRPKGHVLPENVKSDLPAAIQDIKNSGSSCKMITTTVSDAIDPLYLDVIATAAAEGVKFYRSNWFKYKNEISFEASLDYYQEKIRQLGDLNKRYNIVGCYQNHSGTSIGASFWEVKKILESTLPEFFGAQYDIRHAVAEGGRSWPNGVKLLSEHIKTIVLKDFKWGKVNGRWEPVNVPIGAGMVDFTSYFKLLKKIALRPPTSLHLEYPLGGAERGNFSITVDKKVIFDAMKKDLAMIQKLWKQA
jgi:sugar phosphate isomerase/epimerase